MNTRDAGSTRLLRMIKPRELTGGDEQRASPASATGQVHSEENLQTMSLELEVSGNPIEH